MRAQVPRVLAMLLPATLLLAGATASRPAAGCEPGVARIRGLVPPDRAADVPTDARLGLWWSNYDQDPAFLDVRADGVAVTGSTETRVHQESAGAWTGLTEFTPDQPFSPGARVQATVPSPNGGERTWSFVVGQGPAEEAIAAPSLLRLTVHEREADPQAPCGEARRTFTGEIGIPAEADPLSWLLLHRTTPEGTLDEWFTVVGTAADAPLTFSVSSDDLDRDIEVECFTVVQVDPAGGLVSSAEARCADVQGSARPDPAEGAGCAAAPAAAGLAWLLVWPALRRRRR